MDFDAMLEQVLELIQRQRRVSYRALKRRFNVDDEYLEDLKEEILFAYPHIVDEEGRGFIWTGEAGTTPEPVPLASQSVQHPAKSETPLAPHPTSESERRQLTVMFCDLMGSTQLSAQLDPEVYRDVVRAYQTTCAEVIQRYDGHIAQYLGDGLLVYFGYPYAHEDDAQRAVRAGLDSLNAMASLNARLSQDQGLQLAVRIGIHTGPVVVGEMGAGVTQEHLAMGETPNIAARIQSHAEADTVVISAATAHLVEGYFACQALGEHPLRGVAEPLMIYHVTGESGAQSRLDVAPTLTPLVGRDQEVGLLLSRWGRAKEGHGQVILLSGEAGIGKSRLVQALKASVATDPSIQLECRSSPYHQNTALYPIADLIQRILQWQQEDTAEVKLEKLEQVMSPYGVALDESVPLFASLLSLSLPATRYPPLNLSPQLQRQRTFEVTVSILLDLAARQPLLFILEDLHWTDPTTLEFIDLLIDQVPADRLCVLLTCRPTFQPSWSHRSYLTEMTVNHLTHAQVEEIVARLAEGHQLPEHIRQHIVERTDGVPLFVEELTKAILESGQVQANAASLIIPATLQDSLRARLDRLVTAKGVAQIGAAIGRQFSYALLRAVAQLNETDLRRELSRLVDAELLYQHGLLPQATYTFKHALIQDTAYESLLKSTRQHYHQRIIQVLETQFPDVPETQPELLAHHYTEAGDIEPAVRYWHKAGEQAIRRSAHTEATYHLTRGLEVLVALPDRPTRTQLELTLQIALGSVLLATKGYAAPEVEQTYAHAYQLSQHVGDGAQRTQVLLGLRNFYQLRGDLNTAYELGQEVLNLATTQGNTALMVQAHWAIGHTLFFKGVFVSAREHVERSLVLYDSQQHQTWVFRSGIGDLRVQSLATLSWILWPLGYVDQAVTRLNEALDIARQLNHPFSLATALAFATWVYRNRQEPHRVHEPAEELMALATKHGFAFQWARGVFIQGWARAMQGEGLEGIAQMHEGMAAMQKTSAALGQTGWLTALAEACTQIHRLDEAYRFVTEALALTDKYDLRAGESDLHCLLGEILIKQHGVTNGGEAEEHFRTALTIARNQEAKLFELRAATSLARLWQSQDKRQDAYDLLTPIYHWFTEGFDTANLQEARLLLEE